MGSLSIQLRRGTSLVAPASVVLEATEISGFEASGPAAGEVYDPSFHEITYIWTIRGNPLSFSNALNLPTEWKNANVYYGRQVAIAFNDPGTYDVDLWAVDRNGTTGTASYQVTVDPATGLDTICYSTSDFSGAPTGAQQVSSLTELNNALATRSSVAAVRLMFRGGETHDPGGQIHGHHTGRLAVTSFGGGRAGLKLRPFRNNGLDNVTSTPNTEIKFHDIDLIGDWQASHERGVPGGPPVSLNSLVDQFYHRVTISGCEMVASGFLAGDSLYVVSDSHVTSWRNIGVYLHGDAGQGDKLYGFVGTSIRQDVDAPQGNGSWLISHALGPCRIENARNVSFHACDFFSRNGWSGGASLTADQPCLRLNADVWPNVYYNIDRVVCEGGYQVVKMAGESSLRQEVPGNYVIDKLLTIGTPETEIHVDSRFGGVTKRNWYAFQPNAASLSARLIFFARDDIDDGQEQAINQNAPIHTYNCTFLSLLDGPNNNGGDTVAFYHSGDFNTWTAENVLVHMPNQPSPITGTPVDTTTPLEGVTLRFRGRRESLLHVTVPSNGVPNGGTLTVPYAQVPDRDGNGTNQSYWQGTMAAGDNRHHMINLTEGVMFYASAPLLEFDVQPGTSGLIVTNTSGTTWQSGHNLEFKFDHSSQLMPMNTAHSTEGMTVPAAVASQAQSTNLGLIAEDTFRGTARPGRHLPGASSGPSDMGAF